MKQLALFSAALLGFSVAANAQTDSGPQFNNVNTTYKGYVITLTNDTIHGHIRNTNKLDNQTEVLFYNDGMRPAVKADKVYVPAGLKGYKVGSRTYDAMEIGTGKNPKKRLFVLREVTGPLSLYELYSDDSEAGKDRLKRNAKLPEDKRVYNIDESTLQRNNFGLKDGVLTDLSETKYIMSYKKAMSEYFSDYPELAKKIADKEKGYGYMNMLKHVYEYNDWAKANKK